MQLEHHVTLENMNQNIVLLYNIWEGWESMHRYFVPRSTGIQDFGPPRTHMFETEISLIVAHVSVKMSEFFKDYQFGSMC